ncbi:MAG: hypothetical protein JNL25_00790 [Rhodospirillaceae bacterium]|nr:hypothetical protein [Rhodospirillaceae bacterium]
MSFDYERSGQGSGHAGPRDYACHGHERVDFGHTAHRWLNWIKTRPGENWVFFAAGLVLGGIVM